MGNEAAMSSISQSTVHSLRNELRRAAHGPALVRMWHRAALEWEQFRDRVRQPAPRTADLRMLPAIVPARSSRWAQ
jgi:hypothetical protein